MSEQPDHGEHQPEQSQPNQPTGSATGDPRVADAVRRLDDLADLPPAEHVEIYESVHRSLQETLADAGGDDQRDRPAPESDPGGEAVPST